MQRSTTSCRFDYSWKLKSKWLEFFKRQASFHHPHWQPQMLSAQIFKVFGWRNIFRVHLATTQHSKIQGKVLSYKKNLFIEVSSMQVRKYSTNVSRRARRQNLCLAMVRSCIAERCLQKRCAYKLEIVECNFKRVLRFRKTQKQFMRASVFVVDGSAFAD